MVDWVKEAQCVQLTEMALKHAQKLGASAAEVGLSVAKGLSVNVRLGQVETLEFTRDQGFGITLYNGFAKGHASTGVLTQSGIEEALQKAWDIACVTCKDEFAGLAPFESMAKNIPDLSLYHPWDVTPAELIEIAKHAESVALNVDPRITNSEGAGIDTHEAFKVYANSHGFMGKVLSSRHGLSVTTVGEDEKGRMERDYDYTVARDKNDLVAGEVIGRSAAQKTIARLSPRKVPTCKVPVLYDPSVAKGLWGTYLSAVSGGNLYRKTSFLLESLGQNVFSDVVNLVERPHLLKGLGSAPFDAEGVATSDRTLVQHGVVQGYILSAYSASKLGMQTTGNAGGVHNVCVQTETESFEQLLKRMNKGLIVTELMSQGVNMVTGDYSRGAAGFWVENGEIQYPVSEVTIASNLKEMFKGMIGFGDDVDHRGNILTGSVLIDEMTVAGG